MGASRAAPVASAGRVPAEPVPVHVNGSGVSMMYMDMRASSPTAPPDYVRHSPRTLGTVASAADGPAMVPADGLSPMLRKLSAANEQMWLAIGSAAETMDDSARALSAYDSALLHNPYSVPALSAMASVYRSLDHFDLAVEYFQRVLNIDRENGEVWGAMGHCYLMMDELQKAYSAYHQALCHLPDPKEPKLWYGIGILYDRYGSLEHAEETFSSVVRMNPDYEKANEIYFRLGIIYKQQGQFESSLECFRYILSNPPKPLTDMDVWFQIGHVYEQQEEFDLAKEAYERVLSENTNHAKVLQQIGGLYMQPSSKFFDLNIGIQLLHQSLESDPNDPQSWYLLGRAYMDAQEFNKAYDAYQQAVYRDGKNPVLWCSIGILYFQISQFHDALGAFSRSIRLNPYLPEIWLNLGILYETCNNQIPDAIDAYRRALELEPESSAIQQRLQLLQGAESSGKPVSGIPRPKDVPLSAYFAAAASGSLETPVQMPVDETDASRPPEQPLPAVEEPLGHGSPRRMYEDPARLPPYTSNYDYAAEAPPARTYNAAQYEWDRQARFAEESHFAPRSVPRFYEGREPLRYESPAYKFYSHEPRASTVMPPYDPRAPPTHEYDVLSMRQEDLRRKRDMLDMRRASASRGLDPDRRPSGSIAREEPIVPTERTMSDAHSTVPVSSSRDIDEDYDEGAASALMGLAGAATSAYEATNWSRASNPKRALDAAGESESKRTRGEGMSDA